MKILKIDKQNNFFKTIPENLDDLWHLERIIEPRDLVLAKTERKIKPKQEGMETTKENVFFEIQAERIEFHESSANLRILGTITDGHPKELVELKAYHTIDIFPGKEIQVKKTELKNHQIQRLKKAEKATGRDKMLLVVMDDQEAEFAVLKEFGFEPKGKIFSGKSGKRFKNEEKENLFFEKIIEKTKETNPQKIVFAGPGFTKNNFKKFLEDKKIKLQAFFEHTDSVGITGLNQLIKQGTIDKIISEIQIVKETKLVEKILELLGQNSQLVLFKTKEIENAINSNAVQDLIVSDEFLLNNRENTEKILKEAEEKGTQIHICSIKSDAGKKINGFGGITAILRFKI